MNWRNCTFFVWKIVKIDYFLCKSGSESDKTQGNCQIFCLNFQHITPQHSRVALTLNGTETMIFVIFADFFVDPTPLKIGNSRFSKQRLNSSCYGKTDDIFRISTLNSYRNRKNNQIKIKKVKICYIVLF